MLHTEKKKVAYALRVEGKEEIKKRQTSAQITFINKSHLVVISKDCKNIILSIFIRKSFMFYFSGAPDNSKPECCICIKFYKMVQNVLEGYHFLVNYTVTFL